MTAMVAGAHCPGDRLSFWPAIVAPETAQQLITLAERSVLTATMMAG
jgi:hypothetical protein